MKNKICSYARHILMAGITLPSALLISYIACLWLKTDMTTVFLLREAFKAVESALGCVIFSVVCAFLLECSYRRRGL